MSDALATPERLKVVVVDDNPATLYSTGRILENADYQVTRCSRGNDALAAILAGVDAAIIDINLPDIDGIEICRRLRSHVDTRQMAIIHLSATKVDDADRVEGLDAGADAYLTHPVHPQVLLATLRALVRARAAETAMRESEVKFREVFEQAPCGIAVLDGELRFGAANAAMQRMLRCSAGELAGRPITDFSTHEAGLDVEAILACLSSGRTWSGNTRVDFAPGDFVELQWNLSSQSDAGGILCIVADVTERARFAAERERLFGIEREARSEAERIARIKDEFLATLSHELRNPLAPMKNALHILNMADPQSAAATKAREVLVRQVDNMTRLVDDLMDMSRITRGLIHLEKQRASLRSILESAVEASLPQIQAARHQFSLQLPDEPVDLLADSVRLAQVFTNILNNASKYTPAGGRIDVTTQVLPDSVEVAVQDNGMGIPPHMQERIFEVFTQINPTGPVSAGGLGIGLTLVKRLVEMHGGRVTVTSAGAGCGSRFAVMLPRADFPPVSAGVPGAAAATSTQRLIGRAIVIDDNRDGAESLCELLVALGHRCDFYPDGASGIAAVTATAPDLVFVDIEMPHLDGHEVARRLKSSPLTRHIPLFALSGHDEDSDRAEALQSAFERHLVKPVSLDELQSALDAALALPRR